MVTGGNVVVVDGTVGRGVVGRGVTVVVVELVVDDVVDGVVDGSGSSGSCQPFKTPNGSPAPDSGSPSRSARGHVGQPGFSGRT